MGAPAPLGYDYAAGVFAPNAAAATVRYVLNNGFYAGLTQYGELEVAGQHPALVGRAIYDAAHARLLALRPGPYRSQRIVEPHGWDGIHVPRS